MAEGELTALLSTLAEQNPYRTERLLGESQLERTELVYRMLPDGSEEGPYVRKRIAQTASIGAAYARLFAAQRENRPCTCAPHVFACSEDGATLEVVLEYVTGPSLEDYVKERGGSVACAARIFPRLCDAVSELHERFDPPLIHRDLKPGNIILSADRAVLIDFTIARTFDDRSQSDTVTFGTRAYAPPEQFGYAQTTVRSDVYALGMLLYFCLTGNTPDVNAITCADGSFDGSSALKRVFLKATAFDPQNRYPSARSLKEAFEHAIAAPPAPPKRAGVRRMAKKRSAGATEQPESSRALAASAANGAESSRERAVAAPAAPARTMAHTGVKSKPKGAPAPIRIVWNAFVLLFTLFTIIASLALPADPTQAPDTSYAFKAYMSYFTLPLWSLTTCYALVDKTVLRRRFPGNPWFTRKRGFLVLLLVLAVSSVLTVLVAAVLQ